MFRLGLRSHGVGALAIAGASALFLGGRGGSSTAAQPQEQEQQEQQEQEGQKELRTLYPPIEPYNSGCLRVDPTHTLYWEESGNKDGKPVIFLHGGPGGGCTPGSRRFHDPKLYRIVTLDQRGAGKSIPPGETRDNSTWTLVEDIETLRRVLKIEKWQVFGGSWGSFLSIAYAEKHPERVTELVLRGIFMLRPEELKFFYEEGGAAMIYPDAWEEYRDTVSESERRQSLMLAYAKMLNSSDEKERLKAARAWSRWELSTCRLVGDPNGLSRANDDKWASQFARIENHFFINKGWLPYPNYLLDNIHRIRHIPTVIVQGRYDCVCPMHTSWDLHKKFPEAQYTVVTAGHSAMDPAILHALIRATDRFAKNINGNSNRQN